MDVRVQQFGCGAAKVGGVSIAAGDYRTADTSGYTEWLADTNYRCLSYMLSHADYPLVYPSGGESYGRAGSDATRHP